MEGTVQFSTVPSPRFSSWFDSKTESIQKGVNKRSKHVTQTQQQRPESPTVTLTWHVCKYKGHKLHLRDILWWRLCTLTVKQFVAFRKSQLVLGFCHLITSGQIKHLKVFHASSKPKSPPPLPKKKREKTSSQFWTRCSQQQNEPRKNKVQKSDNGAYGDICISLFFITMRMHLNLLLKKKTMKKEEDITVNCYVSLGVSTHQWINYFTASISVCKCICI